MHTTDSGLKRRLLRAAGHVAFWFTVHHARQLGKARQARRSAADALEYLNGLLVQIERHSHLRRLSRPLWLKFDARLQAGTMDVRTTPASSAIFADVFLEVFAMCSSARLPEPLVLWLRRLARVFQKLLDLEQQWRDAGLDDDVTSATMHAAYIDLVSSGVAVFDEHVSTAAHAAATGQPAPDEDEAVGNVEHDDDDEATRDDDADDAPDETATPRSRGVAIFRIPKVFEVGLMQCAMQTVLPFA